MYNNICDTHDLDPFVLICVSTFTEMYIIVLVNIDVTYVIVNNWQNDTNSQKNPNICWTTKKKYN